MAISATLIPSVSAARAGDLISYEVVNTGSDWIMFGSAYRFERFDGERWFWSNPDQAFRAVAFTLGPGGRRTLRAWIPDEVPPGRCRLAKEISLHQRERSEARGKERITASFELRVEAG